VVLYLKKYGTQTQITNWKLEDFMNIFNERNNDISENLYSKESALKYNITVSIFRYLLELEKDEMLREILVKLFY
jgi:hypothetical protein